jgi:hypothetical protein
MSNFLQTFCGKRKFRRGEGGLRGVQLETRGEPFVWRRLHADREERSELAGMMTAWADADVSDMK